MEINAKLLSELANFCENAILTNDSYTRLVYELIISAKWGNQSTSFYADEPMYDTLMLHKKKLEALGFIITYKNEFGIKMATISWEDAK